MTTRRLLSALATGAVAIKAFEIPAVEYVEVIHVLNPSDPGYQVCIQVGSYLGTCIAEAGGAGALSTANPTKLAECACCVGTTDIAPAFSTCSNYLQTSDPALSSQISAYNALYAGCKAVPNICSIATPAVAPPPKSTAVAPAPTVVVPSATPTPVPATTSLALTDEAVSTATGDQNEGGSLTSVPASIGSAACSNLVGVFDSCTAATSGFATLPFDEQAHCYCCSEINAGRFLWTTSVDEYAQTCSLFAKTGAPNSVYTVASVFATFCEHFTDACRTTIGDGSSQTATDNQAQPTGESTTSSSGPVTVTVVQSPTHTAKSGSGPQLRVGGAAAVLAAVVGMAALL